MQSKSVVSDPPKSLPRIAAWSGLSLGVGVLFGWLLDVSALKTVLPGLASMKANTALCFVAASAGLLALEYRPVSKLPTRSGSRPTVWICSLVVVAIALPSLIEQSAGLDFGIDEMLFRDLQGSPPGRMSVATALAFLLIGLSLPLRPEKPRELHATTLASGGVLLIAFSALLGYVIDTGRLYRVPVYSSMALHTALGLAMLASGILARAIAYFDAVSLYTRRIQTTQFTFAAAIVLGAAWLRHVLGEVTELNAPYVTFFPAVTLVAVLMGWRAGVVATGLASGLAVFLFLDAGRHPLWPISISTGDVIGLVLFVTAGLSVSIIAGRLHQFHSRTIEANQILELTVRERTAELAQALFDYRSLFDAADTGKAEVDLKSGRFTRVNPSYCSLTGYSEAELRDKLLLEMTHPDDRQHNGNIIELCLRGEGGAFEVEQRYLRKDGQTVWVNLTGTILRDAQGRVTRLLATARDISEHRQAENELRASSKRIQALFENAAVGIAEVARDGTWIEVNARLCEITGYTREELLARTFQDITHPDDLDVDLTLAEEVIDGARDSYQMDKRYSHKNGTWIWINLTVGSVRDENGKFTRFVSVIKDISSRKQAEEAARASDAFRRSVFEASPDCVKVLTIDGKLEEMNANGQCLMEIDDFSQVKGRRWTELWPEAARADIEAALAKGKEGGTSQFRAFCQTTKGTPKWWHVIVSPVQDAHGQTINLVASSRDVTESRAQEEALRARTAELAITFETAATGLVRVDTQLRYLNVNSAYARYAGLPASEIIGRHMSEVLGEEAIEIIRPNLERVLNGEVVSSDVNIRLPQSGKKWLEVHLAPEVRNAKVVGFIGSIQDITARKLAEGNLRDRLSEIEAIYENAPVGLALLDRDCRFLRINTALAEINGVPASEHLGRSAWDIVPSLRETMEPKINHVFQTGERIEIEVVGETPRQIGVKRSWIEKYYPLVDSEGVVTAVGATVEEITERKAAQEHREFLMRELAHRQKNQLAVVQSMASQTARAASSLEEFRSSFIHRIQGLAIGVDLLVSEGWTNIRLNELAHRQLAPFMPDASRLRIKGPPAMIDAETTQALGLALHELATNALKYGAWSVPSGTITLEWNFEPGSDKDLTIVWQEAGGPEVRPPQRHGFGYTVVDRMISKKLRSRVNLEYRREGVHWSITIDAARR